MEIDFKKASFKDYENIPGATLAGRAQQFGRYLDYLNGEGHLNYRLVALTGSGPVMQLRLPGGKVIEVVALVSNDYLNLTQHPKVKAAAIAAIEEFGTGTGASPAIGGHFAFHEQLEENTAAFFYRESAIGYTTGYNANSATIQCLLRKEDICYVDAGVHTSVIEGCQLTNLKTFPHNDLDALEQCLKIGRDHYRNRMVVVDGVYSQDGDLAKLPEISALCKQYGAYLMVDDAHGTGVIGETGRGLIEVHDMFKDVDFITGTYSKTLGHLGGYVVADPELIRFLKFQSRQHLFSVTATPASACILTSLALIDEEPQRRQHLWENIGYLKSGLGSLGLDTGTTQSAIIPVKIGDPWLALEAGRLLLEAGIYANPIMYPAVARKDARIRMSVMATHKREHLDRVLNAWEWVAGKLCLTKAVSA